jgi:hypothetical protein
MGFRQCPRTEFAQYGIAGARVERIGEAADSNKAQIYHYFGGAATGTWKEIERLTRSNVGCGPRKAGCET